MIADISLAPVPENETYAWQKLWRSSCAFSSFLDWIGQTGWLSVALLLTSEDERQLTRHEIVGVIGVLDCSRSGLEMVFRNWY
jgi:hypothetical protein